MCAQALKPASIRTFSHNLLLGFSFATPLIIINAVGCVWERPNKTAHWSGWLLQMLILDATKKTKKNISEQARTTHSAWPSPKQLALTVCGRGDVHQTFTNKPSAPRSFYCAMAAMPAVLRPSSRRGKH